MHLESTLYFSVCARCHHGSKILNEITPQTNKQTNKHQKSEVKKYSYQDCGLVNLTISVFSAFVVNSDMYDIQITEYHCLCSVFHLDYQNNK